MLYTVVKIKKICGRKKLKRIPFLVFVFIEWFIFFFQAYHKSFQTEHFPLILILFRDMGLRTCWYPKSLSFKISWKYGFILLLMCTPNLSSACSVIIAQCSLMIKSAEWASERNAFTFLFRHFQFKFNLITKGNTMQRNSTVNKSNWNSLLFVFFFRFISTTFIIHTGGLQEQMWAAKWKVWWMFKAISF